ncbi:hypothetical protein EMCRGX_G009626 [Ephydatia muelleri]
MKELGFVQAILGIARFTIITSIILYCLAKLAESPLIEHTIPSHSTSNQSGPIINATCSSPQASPHHFVLDFSVVGWVLSIPVFTYAQTLHPGIPSLTYPIKQKMGLHWFMVAIFGITLFCYMTLGIVVSLWFRGDINETASLNWVIMGRDTSQRKHSYDGLILVAMRAAVAILPIVCSLFISNLVYILKYGGLVGFLTAFFFPLALQLASQYKCVKVFGKELAPAAAAARGTPSSHMWIQRWSTVGGSGWSTNLPLNIGPFRICSDGELFDTLVPTNPGCLASYRFCLFLFALIVVPLSYAPPWHPQPHPPHQVEDGAPLVHGGHLWHHPLLLHDTGNSGVLVVRRETASLNWVPLTKPGHHVALCALSYIIILFPILDVISAYPLVTCSMVNNLYQVIMRWDTSQRKHLYDGLILVAMRAVVAILPIVCSLFISNLVYILKYGGLVGFLTAFFFPLALQLASQYKCVKVFGKELLPAAATRGTPLQPLVDTEMEVLKKVGEEEGAELTEGSEDELGRGKAGKKGRSPPSMAKAKSLYMTPYSIPGLSHPVAVVMTGLLGGATTVQKVCYATLYIITYIQI